MRTAPVVTFALLLAVAAHGEKSRRMTADAVKLKGLTLEKTLDADLDGDGKRELVAICNGPKGIQPAIVGEDADGAVVTLVGDRALGDKVAKAEVQALIPPKGSQQVILEVYDETPDEKVKRVHVYGAGLKDLFTSKVERPKSADDKPEWEKDKTIIAYGDPRPGWYFEDIQEDGVSEVIVRRNSDVKILHIKKDGGDDVKLLTGVREHVWNYNADKAAYVEGEPRWNDFLPAYPVKSLEASSAWIEPKELKELKAKALSEALQNATAKDPKAAKEVTDEVKIDLAPYIKRVADSDMSTAWIENDEKGDGKGEWVELGLEDAQPIHMVRLVLGCVGTKEEFKSHNVPETFQIQLDNGGPQSVNRREKAKFEGLVQAFTDELVKIPDRPYAKTTLVFFDGKESAKKVRVTLDKSIRQGKGNLTCISEVSVH